MIEKNDFTVYRKYEGDRRYYDYNFDQIKKRLLEVVEGLWIDEKIEEYIDGQEITSFVLNGEVFPTVMIKSKNGEFFDRRRKYKSICKRYYKYRLFRWISRNNGSRCKNLR